MSRPSFTQQFITMADDKTLDQSWAIAHFAVFRILPSVIGLLVALAAADVILNKHDAQIAGLGGGIAAVIGAVAGFIAAAALILRQDRATPAAPGTAATGAVTTTTTTTAPADPVPAATSSAETVTVPAVTVPVVKRNTIAARAKAGKRV